MTDPYPWRPERVRVGTVGKPHGLDGFFRVADPCGWWTFRPGSELLVDGVIRCVAATKGDELAPLVALEAARDRTAVEALRGRALELPRAVLPEPDEDAYFRFDLIGCALIASDGSVLGTVDAVEDGVAHDLLVVGETRVPFVAAIVPQVDVPGRRLTLAEGFVAEVVE